MKHFWFRPDKRWFFLRRQTGKLNLEQRKLLQPGISKILRIPKIIDQKILNSIDP